MEGTYHVPVLCKVAVQALLRDPGWTYVDGTLGGGGHAEKICELLSPEGRCIGFDCDEDAVRVAAHRLERFGHRMTCVRANFREIRRELQLRGVRVIGGVLLDLGVSSFQIDEGSRGFSFRESGPLDMRMDRRETLSALEIVNEYSESALADILFRYGEERKARRVARSVVAGRPIASTSDLRVAVEKAVGQQFLLKSLARVFQALRIAVNGELENLSLALEEATSLLLPGGRLVVISYHSLEDRIVKQFFRTAAAQFAPSGHKLVPDARLTPRLRIVTPHPVEPTPGEIAQNPRARSARMRVAEKLKASDSSRHA